MNPLFCGCFGIFLPVFSPILGNWHRSLDYHSIPRMNFWDRKDCSSLNIRPYSPPELGILLGPLDRQLVSFLASCKNTTEGSLFFLIRSVKYLDELGWFFSFATSLSFLNPCTLPLSSHKNRSPKISHDLHLPS